MTIFGWVLFRAESLTIAMHYAATMTGLAKASTLLEIPAAILLDNRAIFIMFLATLMSFVPKFKIEPIAITLPKSKFGVLAHGTAIFLFVIFSCAFMAARGYTPFLYFRF